jgi:hypothetical protein
VSRVLERAWDDLGALVATTAIVLRRGLVAALLWLVAAVLWLVGVTAVLTLLGMLLRARPLPSRPEEWPTILAVLGFFAVPLLYGGLLAAFTLALDGRPGGRALLALVIRSYFDLFAFCCLGALLALLSVATAAVAYMAFRDWMAGSAGGEPALARAGTVGILALAPLWLWCRYFVLPAAALFVRKPVPGESALPAEIAATRPATFLAVMLLPPALLLAAIPDPASQSAGRSFLDPGTLSAVRVATSVGLIALAVLLTAALSVAACRLRAPRLEEAP